MSLLLSQPICWLILAMGDRSFLMCSCEMGACLCPQGAAWETNPSGQGGFENHCHTSKEVEPSTAIDLKLLSGKSKRGREKRKGEKISESMLPPFVKSHEENALSHPLQFVATFGQENVELVMSGSGKLKEVSVANAAVGENWPLKPYPKFPKPKLGDIPGLGRLKGGENLGERAALNRGERWNCDDPRECNDVNDPFSWLTTFSPTSPPAIECASCRIATLPGLSNCCKELAQIWSLGERAGRGEIERGETANEDGLCAGYWTKELRFTFILGGPGLNWAWLGCGGCMEG